MISKKLAVPSMKAFEFYRCNEQREPDLKLDLDAPLPSQGVAVGSCIWIAPSDSPPHLATTVSSTITEAASATASFSAQPPTAPPPPPVAKLPPPPLPAPTAPPAAPPTAPPPPPVANLPPPPSLFSFVQLTGVRISEKTSGSESVCDTVVKELAQWVRDCGVSGDPFDDALLLLEQRVVDERKREDRSAGPAAKRRPVNKGPRELLSPLAVSGDNEEEKQLVSRYERIADPLLLRRPAAKFPSPVSCSSPPKEVRTSRLLELSPRTESHDYYAALIVMEAQRNAQLQREVESLRKRRESPGTDRWKFLAERVDDRLKRNAAEDRLQRLQTFSQELGSRVSALSAHSHMTTLPVVAESGPSSLLLAKKLELTQLEKRRVELQSSAAVTPPSITTPEQYRQLIVVPHYFTPTRFSPSL